MLPSPAPEPPLVEDPLDDAAPARWPRAGLGQAYRNVFVETAVLEVVLPASPAVPVPPRPRTEVPVARRPEPQALAPQLLAPQRPPAAAPTAAPVQAAAQAPVQAPVRAPVQAAHRWRVGVPAVLVVALGVALVLGFLTGVLASSLGGVPAAP